MDHQSPSQAQAYLVAIINSSDDAIISKDLNGNITSWNPAATRIFGYQPEEVIGKHISIIIPAEHLKEEDLIIDQVRKGTQVEHFESSRHTKTGEMVDLSITISPIKDNGEIIGISTVARDITDIKKAERSSAYLAAIIESSDDAIISKNLSGFITSWNKGAENIFGFPAEEALGRHVTMLIPSERFSEEDVIISKLKAGERIEHFETIRRNKNGNLIPVSLTVSPIKDTNGNVIGASKIARDISDKVNAEKAIREINSRKEEFLANMSHELRTPMNAIIGLTHLLGLSKTLNDKERQFVKTLHTSSENLMELINDLLDFAKIESGNLEIENIEFNLIEEIEKLVSIINVQASEKNLALAVNYHSITNHFYMGDSLRISQILMNLLSNAVKFTDQGAIDVNITAQKDAGDDFSTLTFKISDTGVGIAEDKLTVIFDKFIQADSSITRKFGGSGLGLTITKALVERMNGTISVTSQVGIGTSFSVSLPLKNCERKPSKKKVAIKNMQKLPAIHKNILLVEDYEPNILVAAEMIESLGYSYEVASNGMEAIRKFMNSTYDVILMDIQMHNIDGLDATRRIRALELERNLAPTTIIAMTAHVREQDKAKCTEAGMNDFIPKPFDPIGLGKKLGSIIRG